MENNEVKEVKQLSYEELENAARQLSIQVETLKNKNMQLMEVIKNADIQNVLKRLEWLWNIMHTEIKYLTEDFKEKCAKEFMELMTEPEETKE